MDRAPIGVNASTNSTTTSHPSPRFHAGRRKLVNEKIHTGQAGIDLFGNISLKETRCVATTEGEKK